MDEEQSLASPISGSLQGIRRSVSSSIFTGRALPQINQPDPQTTSLISQNSLALTTCLLYTSPSPRDGLLSRMPSSA